MSEEMTYQEGEVYHNIDIAHYKAWLQKQTCKWCGAAYADKKPGDLWLTEWDCGCKWRENETD